MKNCGQRFMTLYRRQVRWSGISISLRNFQFVVIHTFKGFGVVSEAEVDVFLELSFSLIQQITTLHMDITRWSIPKSD